MEKTSEQQTKKEYNKKYYETNKIEIAKKLYAKVTCPDCERCVSHQNLKKHQKTSYCKSKSYVDVRKQLEDLQNEIIKLKENSTKV
jgi:hypothetical protein